MCSMHGTQRFGQQVLDHPAQQLVERKPEEASGMVVDEHDLARSRDDHDCVGRRIEQRPPEIVAIRLENWCPGAHGGPP